MVGIGQTGTRSFTCFDKEGRRVPKPKLSPPPPLDNDAELITSEELADLFRTSPKAIALGRLKRVSWLPKPRYLGRRVLYVKSEALAMLRTEREAA